MRSGSTSLSRGRLWLLVAALVGCHRPPAAPTLSAVDPPQGAAAGNVYVRLTGTELVNGARVLIGGAPSPWVSWASATRVSALAPAHAAGTVDVTVVNPDGQETTLAGGFTYIAHAPTRPGCQEFSQWRPSGCPQAATTFSVTLTQLSLSTAMQVQLAGDFTNWEGIAMQLDASGAYTTSVPLRPNTYQYKYIVDGTWYADPGAPTEPISGNSLRLVTDPCLPSVTLTSPAMGQFLETGATIVLATVAPGVASDGTVRALDSTGVVLCVDDLPYPVVLDPMGSVSAALNLPDGLHRVSVQAQDSGGFTTPQAWSVVRVSESVHAPIADPGPTRFIRLGDTVILDGTSSQDPDGRPITGYQWTFVDGPITLNASDLPDGNVSLPEGYQTTEGQNDPNAIPASTPGRKLFTPSAAGVYTFSLSVLDANGASTNTHNQTQVVCLPETGPRPRVQLAVTSAPQGPVVLDASASQRSATASFTWLADVNNPATIDLTPFVSADGAKLTLPRDPFTEGVWRFYVWIDEDNGSSWQDGAQVTVLDGTIRADEYYLAPAWAFAGPMDELFVRHFYDSNGDGIGDLPGVTAKLDYLQGLGISTLWLMPIFASTDHDHGYSTFDYYDIEGDYGVRADLLELIQQMHARGMKLILDLASNDTDLFHPFFQQSLNSFMNPGNPGPASQFLDWYIWFDNGQTNLLNEYGWGRQLGGTRLLASGGWNLIPDIDYGNPATRRYMFDLAKYWTDPNGDGDPSDGIDGWRLDHVTGPDHGVWAAFRSELKALNPDLLLVGEVFQDFVDSGLGYGIQDYYRGELDSAFTYPLYWDYASIWGSAGDPTQLQPTVASMLADPFPPGALHISFLENQDVPTNTTAYDVYGEPGLMAALALQVGMPAIPQAIWGQELGLTVYRGNVPWENEGPDNALENTFRSVMLLRQQRAALRSGSFNWARTSNAAVVGILRQVAGEPAIVDLVNTSASEADAVDVDLTPIGPVASLKPLVGPATATVSATNHATLTLPADGFVIYEAEPAP